MSGDIEGRVPVDASDDAADEGGDGFSPEALFAEFFERWYTDEQRAQRGWSELPPRWERAAERLSSPFAAKARAAIGDQIRRMADAAARDWSHLLGPGGRLDGAFLDKLDRVWAPDRVRELVVTVNAADQSNDYVVLCCELGASLGSLLARAVPECTWVERMPYWESFLQHPSGQRAWPFHWAVRRLSGDERPGALTEELAACAAALAG